jgi:hypothetical protein
MRYNQTTAQQYSDLLESLIVSIEAQTSSHKTLRSLPLTKNQNVNEIKYQNRWTEKSGAYFLTH